MELGWTRPNISNEQCALQYRAWGGQHEKSVLHQLWQSVQEVLPRLQRHLPAYMSTCRTQVANKPIYTVLCQHGLLIASADKERAWKGACQARVAELGWVSSLSATLTGGGGTRCCIVPQPRYWWRRNNGSDKCSRGTNTRFQSHTETWL